MAYAITILIRPLQYNVASKLRMMMADRMYLCSWYIHVRIYKNVADKTKCTSLLLLQLSMYINVYSLLFEQQTSTWHMR